MREARQMTIYLLVDSIPLKTTRRHVVFTHGVCAVALARGRRPACDGGMDEQEEERLPVVPLGEKKLRACLVTGLVKTEEQWLREGNDNVPCLELERDREKMFECTSADFDGMAAIMQPNASWVARWQGVASPNFVPGCYALRVRGLLPNEHVVTLEDNGIRYRALDGS